MILSKPAGNLCINLIKDGKKILFHQNNCKINEIKINN